MREFNREEFEKLYHENMSLEKTRKILGYSRYFIDKMEKEGKFQKIPPKGRHITEEHKEKTSAGVKKFLKENRNGNMFQNISQRSIPCEHLKSELRNHGFDFIEEYQCFSERFYRLDIAFPLKKICFEVNGCFHYDNHGKLKQKYQERHDFIVSKGWNVIEIPHMMVYNEEYVNYLISILNDNNCIEDKYEDLKQELIRKEKEKHICPICGGEKKTTQSKICLKCYASLCRENTKHHKNVCRVYHKRSKTILKINLHNRKNKLMFLNHDELISAISGKTMTQIAVEFKTSRSRVVKMLRKIFPEYKNYTNNCNDTKDLSFLTDEQLLHDIQKISLDDLAKKHNTTKNHICNELKKRNIHPMTAKMRQLPSDFTYDGISLRELSRKYGVDRKVIKRWINEQKLAH